MFKSLQTRVVVMLGVLAVTSSAPLPDNPLYGPPSYPSAPQHLQASPYKEEHQPKPYAFDYGVQDDYTGANFGHTENSDGQAVKGSYKVALPDGRIQTVSYVADHKNGFQAQVSYEGQAVYPEYHQPAPPAYPQPAPPSYPAPSPYA